eukprot:970697-Pelagomonas_calceolata.AAC.2
MHTHTYTHTHARTPKPQTNNTHAHTHTHRGAAAVEAAGIGNARRSHCCPRAALQGAAEAGMRRCSRHAECTAQCCSMSCAVHRLDAAACKLATLRFCSKCFGTRAAA